MSDLFPRPRRNPAAKQRNPNRADIEHIPAPPTVELNGKGQAERVRLRTGRRWRMREMVTEMLIRSLFTRRTGEAVPNPNFAPLGQGQVRITWIGHASFLVEIGGKNVLIDPNWSLWLKLIKRLKKPGLRLRDLPVIDLVLVTHAHFDHLDKRTLRAVAANQPIVVPHGVGRLVHDLGFERVHQLEPWGTFEFENLSIMLTPCVHWGARVLADYHRGFGGFRLACGERSVFHAGDSAYFEGFREIAARAPVEIALLPIGAYDAPTQREVHMNPEEAVQAFLDLRAERLVPMHYGSFRLGLEPIEEPPRRLLEEANRRGLAGRVCMLDEGVPRIV